MQIGAFSLLFCMKIVSTIIIGLSLNRELVSSPSMLPCLQSFYSSLVWAAWIPDILFQSVALYVAVTRTWQHIKEDSVEGFLINLSRCSDRPIFGPIFRNSVVYFSCLLVLLLTNCLLCRFGNSWMAEMFQSPSQSVMTIIGSRLLLHSREARDGGFRPELEMESLDEIQFASGSLPRTAKKTKADTDDDGEIRELG